MHPQMRQLLVHLGAGRLRDNREDAGLMLHAAPFHDIGKLGIARHNLLKPRRLDPDEWDVMQTHVEIGAGLIDGIDVPYQSMACSIALTHHERWDGSGYPKELKGENIHIEGRLTALCDVFDALTSDRPLHARLEFRRRRSIHLRPRGHSLRSQAGAPVRGQPGGLDRHP